MKPKLAILILVLFIGSCLTASAWWKRSWAYRKAITIDNTGNSSVLTNYQVCFTNGFTNLITAGKMKADAADMRFVDSNDSTLLSHYVQMSEMQSSEMIPNGGMELSGGGDPEIPGPVPGNYIWANSYAETNELIQEDVDFHSGAHSWHINVNEGGEGVLLETHTLESNGWYSMEIWVKGVSGQMRISHGKGPDWYWTPAVGVWTKYTNTFQATSSGSIVLRIDAYAAAAEFYIDDFSMKRFYPFDEKVWVKVPSIPASSSNTIYMYYGNTNATSVASFDNTFTKDYSNDADIAAQWHMDDGGVSATIADSSGTGNTGYLSNFNFTANSGWVGSDGGTWAGRTNVGFSTGDCLRFDGAGTDPPTGSGDYVDCGNDPSLIASNTLTVELWFNSPMTNYSETTLLGCGQNNVAGYRMNLRWYDTMQMAFNAELNGSRTDVSMDYYPFYTYPDSWNHWVFTYNGTNFGATASAWINGIAATPNGARSNYITQTSQDLKMGTWGAATEGYYQGMLDDVRIYNRTLSDKEVKCHYERRKYTEPEPSTSLGGEETVPPPQGTSFSIH